MKKPKVQKITFSSASETIEAWTGGDYYKRLYSVEIFGIKIEFWKHKNS